MAPIDEGHVKSLDEKLRAFVNTLSPEESAAFRYMVQRGQGATDEELEEIVGGQVEAGGHDAYIRVEISGAGDIVTIESR
ncbi:MAG: hypothetical protein GEU88_11760 [Solirubrobacterales bacterium]|nr:hypothetical protein [Solirubrobacterales bacterium]